MRVLVVKFLALFFGLSISLSASASFYSHYETELQDFPDSQGLNNLLTLLQGLSDLNLGAWAPGEAISRYKRGGKKGWRGHGRDTELELENFLVKASRDKNYGLPKVAGDDSLVFSPRNMSASARKKYVSESFTSPLFTFLPSSEGFQFNTLSILEYGDYKYRGRKNAEQSEFDFSVSLFISDFNDPFNYERLLLETSIEVDESTGFETWELSGEFDISAYADGFFLKIQNSISLDPGKGAKFLYAEKKGIVLGVDGDTAVIPIPATAWLFGTAIVGMMTLRRRAL